MQVLKLVSIEGFLEGGSSKPLLITAQTEEGEAKQYVMKLFKSDYVEQNYSVAKEIFISELAKEFDLFSPDYALIQIDNSVLSPYFSEDEINNFDKGYKFCSEYKEQYLTFNAIASIQFVDKYDIENLFCFDHLVINTDRGGFRNKPNLLINDKELLLIDHELTLPFVNNTSEIPNYYTYINNYPFFKHVAIDYIKRQRNRTNLFEDFFENLKFLNLDKFKTIFDQLDDLKVNYGNRDKIFAYLNWAKANITLLNKHFYSCTIK